MIFEDNTSYCCNQVGNQLTNVIEKAICASKSLQHTTTQSNKASKSKSKKSTSKSKRHSSDADSDEACSDESVDKNNVESEDEDETKIKKIHEL